MLLELQLHLWRPQ